MKKTERESIAGEIRLRLYKQGNYTAKHEKMSDARIINWYCQELHLADVNEVEKALQDQALANAKALAEFNRT